MEESDVEDLLYLLEGRFGSIDSSVRQMIKDISDFSTLNRLILVAANVSSYRDFLQELENKDSFKIAGDRFNPLKRRKVND
ncbi:MAG: hypothetical protein M1113_05910 [Candidatus Thermoplasmatota archaeon]|nr:hypothetical protein [Candidatus Thermoplasmatota archaeon]